MLRFSSYELGDFFIVWRHFCYVFFTWGAFLLRLPPGVKPFSQYGDLFCYFFLHLVGLFCLHGGFHVFMGIFMGLPLIAPYDLFCGRMLLCKFHLISSAVTYSGHCCCCCCCCCDNPVHRAALLGHHHKKNDKHLVLSID